MGRLNIPFCVFTLTTRTKSSFPLNVSITLPRGHWVGIILSSCSTTMSPTEMFLLDFCHLTNFLRVDKYSCDHLRQKCLTIFWHMCQRRSSEMDRYEYDESGSASIGLPIRKWPGVNISIPSSSQGVAIKGRLFKHASICVRIV